MSVFRVRFFREQCGIHYVVTGKNIQVVEQRAYKLRADMIPAYHNLTRYIVDKPDGILELIMKGFKTLPIAPGVVSVLGANTSGIRITAGEHDNTTEEYIGRLCSDYSVPFAISKGKY